MEFIQQSIDDILSSLSSLSADWEDETSKKAIERINQIPIKAKYTKQDIIDLFSTGFTEGMIICQLFLGISKDTFHTELNLILGPGIRVTRFNEDRAAFIQALVNLGLLDAMAQQANREPKWSDVLIERLRSGRGKAIRGQRRGRGLEDFTEKIIKKVFVKDYDTRCQFIGSRGVVAKCDFAIPSRKLPRILIEAKAYGATGSKMSDVIGDLDSIIREKRHDTMLLFVTDGLTWNQRKGDLKKIIERQNRGEIARIYTTMMSKQLEIDLKTLKEEHKI